MADSRNDSSLDEDEIERRFNDLARLSRKVNTEGLIKLTVLTETDCNAMRGAFGRCSMLLHSQPGELNPRLPPPPVIETEIETLSQWVANIRLRQEKAS